jgi:hypothetical protein
MCYSAEVSFFAGGVLAAASVSIARIPRVPASLPLAAIPAVFAAHQLTEGFIWLSQSRLETGNIHMAALTLYVLIAYIFWPIFIPYAVWRLEAVKWRQALMIGCQVIGIAVGLNFLLGMLQTPVGATLCTGHIAYQVASPWHIEPAYLVAVILPFLVSSRRGLLLFGLAVAGSCAIGLYLTSFPAFPSVWCFFAALLSGVLYAYFKAEQRATVPQVGVRAVTC